MDGSRRGRYSTGRPLLVNEVYGRLLPKLVRLEIAPGEPLNEKRIAEEFEVGRQPVRSALNRLETDGLVTVYPRRGTFATEVRLEDLGAITEVRLEARRHGRAVGGAAGV
ncbi:MAG: GntR family transcriptional regulator [Nocardioides sp.]|uniref:GntR family transcriptional regulator n=1 Tax=Nocardioides sp. TaxID=35761 RepID=UPI0039E614E6